MSKWIPKFFVKRPDGGENSGVTAFFLIEWKAIFSIALLRFGQNTTRRNYHSHAFNAITWWLKGQVVEEIVKFGFLAMNGKYERTYFSQVYKPSLIPKQTPKESCHRICPSETSWALTFRGPWNDKWYEFNPETDEITWLTYGREVIDL